MVQCLISQWSRSYLASCLCVLALVSIVNGQDEPPGALQSIEQNRGGRHWVDAKTAAPKSPQESQACFQVEPGVTVQLVAAEPLVRDPVAIAFDWRGRLFVVEYADYPIGGKDGQPLSRVVLLTDQDGDGRYDKRHVFADRLTFAHSLLPYDDGILVGAQSKLVFLKDTTGDNRADIRRVLYQGFVAAHPQMQIGNPRWGFDNQIYCNYGPGKISRPGDTSKSVTMPRAEFRFNPRTGEFGPAAGLGQFGNTIDNWGRRFFCTNRNPVMTPMFTRSQTRLNPYQSISRSHYDVGPSGGATRVYPLVAMKSNYLSHAGTHTSACGTTAYRGHLFPSWGDSVFVCEPIGHLVTRSVIDDSSHVLNAKRARAKADFIASTDTWFRPASLATGPDGALYLADMYRLWVEHPKFLPKEVADKLDWRAGEDRGRIWRFVPSANSRQLAKYQPPKSNEEIVKLLEHANGWQRQLGQQLIVQRQIKQLAPQLRQMVAESTQPTTRLTALCTLDGLGELPGATLQLARKDADWHVRSHGLRLVAAKLAQQQSANNRAADGLAAVAIDSCRDRHSSVRLQAILALAHVDSDKALDSLTAACRADGSDAWFAQAIVASSPKRCGLLLARLLKSDSELSPSLRMLLNQLATTAGSRGDEQELAQLLRALTGENQPAGGWQESAVLSGLATGLGRHRGKLGRTSLSKLLQQPPAALQESVKRLQVRLAKLASVARSTDRSLADREAAIGLLALRGYRQAAPTFAALLSAEQPLPVRLAVLAAMLRYGDQTAGQQVIKQWSTFGPQERTVGIQLLLRRTDTTLLMLQAMEAGTLSAAVFDVDRRVRLLKHGNPQIKALAQKLLGGAVSSDRRQVARKYRAALELPVDSRLGADIFRRACSKCHRINGIGHVVGPDISDVRNRSKEALLYDILDPNRKVEPRFSAYQIVTDEGVIHNGLMVSETANTVVLGLAEGKTVEIPRARIEQMKASGKSLMPEGVEKEVSVAQMAHLLEFLKRQQ